MTKRAPQTKKPRRTCKEHGVKVGAVERISYGQLVHGSDRCTITYEAQ
jgi:hypothetical protein